MIVDKKQVHAWFFNLRVVFFLGSLDSLSWHIYLTIVGTLNNGVLNVFISKTET